MVIMRRFCSSCSESQKMIKGYSNETLVYKKLALASLFINFAMRDVSICTLCADIILETAVKYESCFFSLSHVYMSEI